MIRQHVARVYMEGELLKLISERALSAELHGRAMGPEGSIAKLLWSDAEQHITEVATEVLGPDGLTGPWARDRVYSRALDDRGRHDPGQQEHCRSAHSGASPQLAGPRPPANRSRA